MGTTIISFSRFILSVSLFFFLVVGSARTVVRGEEDDGSKEELRIYKAAFEFLHECGKKEFSLCLKERALRYIDTLPNELDVGVGVKIKSNGRVSKRMQREALPDEPKARESAVENILWDRISDYLSTHVIELKMPSNTVHDMKKSVEEGKKLSIFLKKFIPCLGNTGLAHTEKAKKVEFWPYKEQTHKKASIVAFHGPSTLEHLK
ncbi:uncharacterized protein LOC115884521 [Sitophilus oryzae]|uniref:Uncharacterized protein LOC115884521 n=1 Tax=Sitophilus oryzae TaxID=7048 RepID=A0A6J2Y7B6_SITOR|nr:uncharacterized protein LOC115884521 [Sitophilus oryzae]